MNRARVSDWHFAMRRIVVLIDAIDGAADVSYQTVLTPADQKTGNVIYPYEKALG
jgi:hypothetical protein